MITFKILDELVADIDSGTLMLRNLSDSQREDLKRELNIFKLCLAPVNNFIKYLEPYTEKYKDITELIFNGCDIQRVNDDDIVKLLNNNNTHIRNVISSLNEHNVDNETGSIKTLNIISNITISDHIDKFIEYLRSINTK